MKKRYLLLPLALLPPVFYYGVLTGQDQIFPYDELQEIKHMISMEDVLAIRNTDASGLVKLASPDAYPDRLVFLTYGQSNAANTGQLGYEVKQPVFMVSDGIAYRYADPSIGTTGENATAWGRVGDRLVADGAADAVFFVNVAWGGASMDELASGHAYDYLESQLRQALRTFGRIDGVLIHHGERNNARIPDKDALGAASYIAPFLRLREKIGKLTDAPIYLSQVSYCADRGVDQDLLDVQDDLIRTVDGVLRGVNSDVLVDVKYRLPDGCHFSAAGLDALADQWVTAIKAKSED